MVRPRLDLVTALAAILVSVSLRAQDGAALFDQNCSVCHTIGQGGGAAPDLKGITARLDRAWIVKFTLDPEGVTKSGDPHAVELAKQFDGTIMPPPEGLSREAVEAILSYIDTRSTGAASTTPDASPLLAAFTTDENTRGHDLYTGRVRLANHGAACFSCHQTEDVAGAGGGMLGPNLAGLSQRFNGPKGVSAWLSAPPTAVMKTVYRRTPLMPDEVRALTAFFNQGSAGQASAPSINTRMLHVFGAGLATALVALVAIGFTWRGRFVAVRRPLVEAGATPPPRQRLARFTRQGFRSGGLR